MKKLILFIVVGIGLFTGYSYYAWRTVQPSDAATLGQFGDAFGVCTSLLTFLALVGLIIQLRQTERQHKEECAQQAKEHHDAMAALQKQHDENLAEQKRQHAEALEVQRDNHREELEVQRMGFLSAEHPLIQSNPCALMLFPIESEATLSGKASYCLVWQFFQKGKIVPRNPVFSCRLISASHQTLGVGWCRPGQLPYSQSDLYEVFFPLVNVDPVTENSECSVTVIFQNSLGGCFKYSETNRLSELRVNTKPIPATVFDEALPELVMKCHSISKFFMSKGFYGRTFIRTNQPICDVPLTNTEYQKEVQKIDDMSYRDSLSICQGIIDEQKLARDLTEYLNNHNTESSTAPFQEGASGASQN